MEIILKEDIIGLGYKNDIVNVKSGYGRNYLIPQGKGVIATPMAKKILAENLKQQAHKLAAIKAEAEKKGEALKDVAGVINDVAGRFSNFTAGRIGGDEFIVIGSGLTAADAERFEQQFGEKLERVNTVSGRCASEWPIRAPQTRHTSAWMIASLS